MARRPARCYRYCKNKVRAIREEERDGDGDGDGDGDARCGDESAQDRPAWVGACLKGRKLTVQ